MGLGLLVAQEPAPDLATPESHYRFAEGLFFRKFYDLAEKEYRSFTERFPEHALGPEASYRRILCLRHLRQEPAMLKAMDHFQERWPDHKLAVQLALWKGDLLYNRQDYAGAEAAFRRLTDHEDSVLRETALYFVAQCQERQDHPEAALAIYRTLAESPFDDRHSYRPYALYALAIAAQRRGDNAAASELFGRLAEATAIPSTLREEALYRLAEARFAREAYAEALNGYERVVAEFPEGAFAREARKRLAWARYMTGDFAKAAGAAADWRRLYPEARDVEVDFVQALSLVGLEDHAAALPLFQGLAAAAAGAPDDMTRRARYQEVVCLAALKRLAEVIASADRFAADYPKAGELPLVYFIAGTLCHANNDHEKAAAYLRRAEDALVGAAPQREEAGRLLADSLVKLERLADAAAVFRRLAAGPNTPRAAYYLLKAGECERQLGNHDGAIRDFEDVLAKHPQAEAETRRALQHLGELYPTAGRIDRAIQIVEALLAKATAAPERARLRFYAGYLRYQQDKPEAAIEDLRAALGEADAGSVAAAARFYLGSALLDLGRQDEALDTFAAVLGLPAEDRPPFPADLLLRLETLYYARNQLALSEGICRTLLERPDLAVAQRAALRLSSILAAQSRFEAASAVLDDLRRRRQEALAREPGLALAPDEEILSAQAEVFLLQDQISKAVVAAEQCLAVQGLDQEALTRARWILAEALTRQGHPAQALPYAIKAYILDDHPSYSPRAMVLALRLLVAQQRLDEARTTWTELRQRYPVFAESVAAIPEVKALLDAPPPPG